MKLRIGAVPYGVGAPLVTGLDRRESIELVRDQPSRLIERLRAGHLDAALVSSIEAFRTPNYRAIGGIGICCDGAVRSVRAFRKPGLTRVTTVGVDDASETSSALLRVLLHQLAPGDTPKFERIVATRRPNQFPHDLVMLIGDDGLHADAGDREVLDLGAAWRDWTGLPFVFALWLMPPGAPVDALVRELVDARRRGAAMTATDGTAGAVHYDLGAAELDGLRRFHVEAAKLGLADPSIDVRFVRHETERPDAEIST